MKRARYIDDTGKENEVVAERISPEENENKFRGHLMCEDKLCEARVYYAERHNPRLNRSFKTIPGDNHRKGCINEFERDGNRRAIFSIRGVGTNVSDEHIMSSLRDSSKNYSYELFPNKKKKSKGLTQRKKRKTVPVTDSNINKKVDIRQSPSVVGEGVLVHGEKEPNIHRNEISSLSIKKNEPFIEVHGLVDTVSEMSNDIYWYIKGVRGVKCKIYFGTPFESEFSTEFGLLHLVRDYIKDKVAEHSVVQFHCFGEISEKNGELSVQVYSYKHILIDEMTYYDIINLVRGFTK